MSKRAKSKAIAAVPQSRDEARAQLGQIGTLRRQIKAGIDAGAEKLKAIGEETDAAIAPLKVELAALEAGLQTWCEANRATITDSGKVKYAEFGTGIVRWRFKPASVSLRGGMENVIEAVKEMGLKRFLRVKEEVNKDAMRAEADLARTIPGVSIGSEGEEFEIVPAELEISERQVA